MFVLRAFGVCSLCKCSYGRFPIHFVGGESRWPDRVCGGTFDFFFNVSHPSCYLGCIGQICITYAAFCGRSGVLFCDFCTTVWLYLYCDLPSTFQGEDSRDKQDEKENIKKKEVMITFHDVGMNRKWGYCLIKHIYSLVCLHRWSAQLKQQATISRMPKTKSSARRYFRERDKSNKE